MVTPATPRANGESSAMMSDKRFEEPLVAPNGDRFVVMEVGDDGVAVVLLLCNLHPSRCLLLTSGR